MVPWFRSRRSAITFDLGAAGIRAYQFGQRTGEPKLCDTLQLDRTPSSGTDEPAAPTVDPAQLARLVGQGRFIGQEVTLVLSSPEVQFAPMRLPEQALSQAPERVQQALKWEVAQESRKNADELEVRYWMLPRGRGQAANVVAVVMPAGLAREWCGLLQRQHLTLRRIDVSPCALVRLARRVWTPAENDIWGVLDLGLRHSTLTIVVGTIPTYIRVISVTAHQWTQQLAAAFEVAYPVAEQLKRVHGVEPTKRGGRSTAAARGEGVVGGNAAATLLQDTNLTSAFSGVLRESLHTLAQEVGRCFSYVMQSFPDHSVRRLLLAGGGAGLHGLPAVLTAELDIPVTPLAISGSEETLTWEFPLQGMRLDPCGAAAMGGAMLDLEAS